MSRRRYTGVWVSVKLNIFKATCKNYTNARLFFTIFILIFFISLYKHGTITHEINVTVSSFSYLPRDTVCSTHKLVICAC